jgi:hypothetical protein
MKKKKKQCDLNAYHGDKKKINFFFIYLWNLVNLVKLAGLKSDLLLYICWHNYIYIFFNLFAVTPIWVKAKYIRSYKISTWIDQVLIDISSL